VGRPAAAASAPPRGKPAKGKHWKKKAAAKDLGPKKKHWGKNGPRPASALPASLAAGHGQLALPASLALGDCPPMDLTAELAVALATEMLELPLAPGADSAAVRAALEAYEITPELKRTANYKGAKDGGTIHNRLRDCCPRVCELYETLIREVVGPHLLAHFAAEAEAAGRPARATLSDAERTVLYQFPPAFRVYCSHIRYASDADPERAPGVDETPPAAEGAAAEVARQAEIERVQARYRPLTGLHADAQYGHQAGEINFWLPLTRVDETSTLWAESASGKADWYPFFPLDPGVCWRFPGTVCRHFTKPNISGRTRVSIDFRCSVAACYDAGWRMPGAGPPRHEMRAMLL
jgi:hypothetical protein